MDNYKSEYIKLKKIYNNLKGEMKEYQTKSSEIDYKSDNKKNNIKKEYTSKLEINIQNTPLSLL